VLNFSKIGQALRQLRQDRGLKQAEVASGAGITSPMLSAYETGKQKPSFATIDKILGAMEFDAVDLASALQKASRSEEPPDQDGQEQFDLRLNRLRQAQIQSSELVTEEERLVTHLLPAVLATVRYLKG
jgi:transcriptional regulator with XRE-family HTH domain